jgi:hypothetical protein
MRMRTVVLAFTALFVAAAGPVSFVAQKATGRARHEAPRINGGSIDSQCDSIPTNPVEGLVINVVQCRGKKE